MHTTEVKSGLAFIVNTKDPFSAMSNSTVLSAEEVSLARRRLLQMHFESGVGHLGVKPSCMDRLLIQLGKNPRTEAVTRLIERLRRHLAHQVGATTRLSKEPLSPTQVMAQWCSITHQEKKLA